MPSIGPAEILVVLVVALLVFGPNRMPEIGRQLAKGVREFRRVQQHLTAELHDVVSEFDVDAKAATAPAPTPGGDPVPSLPAKADEPPGTVDSEHGSAPSPASPPPADSI
jgi:sec-independent protein translocase protein TatA